VEVDEWQHSRRHIRDMDAPSMNYIPSLHRLPGFGPPLRFRTSICCLWNGTTSAWVLADFYRFITQAIFGGTFRYDNVRGATRYTQGLGGSCRLDQYFRELEYSTVVTINCYDMAGIVQVVLSLFLNYNLVRWNFMQPYGWIDTTRWVSQRLP
jgi:hypothetical protein